MAPPVASVSSVQEPQGPQCKSSDGKRWRHRWQVCLLYKNHRIFSARAMVASGGATGGKCVFCTRTTEPSMQEQQWQSGAPPVASVSSAQRSRNLQSESSGGKRWRHRWQVCLLYKKPLSHWSQSSGGKWWQVVAPPVASLSSVGKPRGATSGGKRWRHRWQACLL